MLSSTLVPVLCDLDHERKARPARALLSAPTQGPVGSVLGQRREVPLHRRATPRVAARCLPCCAPVPRLEIFPKRSDAEQFSSACAHRRERASNDRATALTALDIIQAELGPDNVAITIGFVGVHAVELSRELIHLWTSGPHEAVIGARAPKPCAWTTRCGSDCECAAGHRSLAGYDVLASRRRTS